LSEVPSKAGVEAPGQNLLFLSERGAIAQYYYRTGDASVLPGAVQLSARCLQLWDTDEDGLAKTRGDGKFDAHYNCDAPVLTNALYYSALKFLRFAAGKTGVTEYDDFIAERTAGIEKAFGDKFYREGGYSSGYAFDDRANAWAVISGLAPPERYGELKLLLSSVQSASPLYENYCVEALCIIGAKDEAFKRLQNRYRAMIDDENPALAEDFAYTGSKCYGAGGGAVKNLFRYIAGVSYADGGAVVITPDLTTAERVEYTVPCAGGEISGSYRRGGKTEIVIFNKSDCDVTLVLESKSLGMAAEEKQIKLGRGKSKFTL
jgi:hypothetical protein